MILNGNIWGCLSRSIGSSSLNLWRLQGSCFVLEPRLAVVVTALVAAAAAATAEGGDFWLALMT